jgi:glycosyltransferase 2 family protein
MDRRWLWLVRVLGTAAGVAWVASVVDVGEVAAAARRIPPRAVAAAVVLVLVNVVVGAVRWRVVLAAYGAARLPARARLLRLYLIAFFYNTYLPGAVAGDLVRGVASRDAFGDRGTTGAVAVVLVERVLGLAGLFALLGVGVLVTDPGGAADRAQLAWWAALGLVASAAAVAAVAAGRRLAPRLPGPIATIAGRLPRLVGPGGLAAALALSVVTQALIVVAGHVLLAGVAPELGLAESLLIVPLAAATTFLPITVGGAGAREAVFVGLAGAVAAVPAGDALAASLALWAAHLAVGAIGGVVQLLTKDLG